MSQLTWVLLGVAAVLLIVLYLYGQWQVRRSAAGDETTEKVDPPNVIGRAARHAPARVEPTLGAVGGTADQETTIAVSSEDTLASSPSVDGWTEDSLLDATFDVRSSHTFDGVAALEARAQLDRLALPLPMHLAVWDSKAGRWSAPDRFGFYSEILIALQLATRRYSLNEIDTARVIAAVQQIAMAIDADFDPPDAAQLVARAADLDAMCSQFDVQITLTLEAQGEAWSRESIDSAARDARLVEARPGYWLHDGAQAPESLSMTAVPPSSRVALTLDVPQAAAEPPPVPTVFRIARQMAQRLKARIVDDNARLIGADAESAIEAKHAKMVDEMRAAGIEPGSPRAQRLFAE